MTFTKNRNDKSSPASCVYQIIRMETNNKFSETYFLGLLLLYMWSAHPRFQPLIKTNVTNILDLSTAVEIEEQKIKSIKTFTETTLFKKKF